MPGTPKITADDMEACLHAVETAGAPRIALRQRILRAGLVALLAAASAMLFVAAPAHAQVVTASLSDSNVSHGVAVDPVTNKIYLADSGGTLTVIDGATNTLSSPSNTYGGLSNWAVAVNPVTNMVYLVDRSADKIYVFNGAVGTSPATYAATISLGTGNFFAIAVNPVSNLIYVCDDDNGLVDVIDGSTNTEVTTVSTGSSGGIPNLPVSVAVNPATSMVYVVENDGNPSFGNSVGVINGSNQLVATIAVGTSPTSVVVNPVTNLIYVANSGSNSVSVIDGSSNSVTATVTSPEMLSPIGLAVNPATNQVFVANSGSDYASVINGTTTPATDVIASNAIPTSGFVSIAVDTSTDQAYLANGSQGTVGVINGLNLSATTDILTAQASANLEQIAVNPVTHKAYAITNTSPASAISVIDGATYAVATPAYPQSQPWAVAVNPVTNTIFVADNFSGTVSVIDGSTNTLDPASPITVGTNPNALVVDPINNLVYVSNAGSSSVTVFNGVPPPPNTYSPSPATISLSYNSQNVTPNLLAFNPVLNQVYGASTGQGVGFSFAGGQNSETVFAGSFSGGSTPIAIGTNPAQGYNYAVFSDTSALQISDIHGGGAFPVCSGPTSADVNTVTNTIYVACGGSSGTLDAIQGADSFTPGTSTSITLTSSNSTPTAVVVNPVTNTVYVTDEPVEDIAYLYVVSPSNNNSVTTVNLGNDGCFSPVSLAVNIASNKIYVLCAGDDNEPGPQVVVFDGATNADIRTLPVGGSVNNLQNEIAADPVTGNIYSLAYLGGNPGAVSVYTENAVQSNSLTTTITPLTNNTTDVISPSFTFNSSDSATGVFFQVDSQQGEWTSALGVPDENQQLFTGTASNLTPGFHILYAYSTDSRHGIAANSGPNSDEDSPVVGAIASYGFLVAPPIATINYYVLNFGTVPPGGVSPSPNPILINNGGSPMTYSYSINGASEFVVDQAQSSCSTSGTLAPNTSCEIYVTFNPALADSGTYTATLTWTDDSLGVSGSMQSIGFTGTAGTSGVTPPVFGEGAANPSYIQNSLFSFSDSDGSVTSYLCSFTTGMTISPNYLPCSQSVSESNLSENMYYTFAVEAVDNQGNVSAPISQTWEVIPSSVSVTFAGSGTGQVTSTSPTGLSCTSNCSVPFDGVPVTIMATPTGGSTFAGWSNEYNEVGNTCTGTTNPCVLQSGDTLQIVTATFDSASSYNLTVTPLGLGTGTIAYGPDVNCVEAGGVSGGTCSYPFSAGTPVTLTETPGNDGSTFGGWGGACASFTTNTTCNVIMNSALTVTANFVSPPQSQTVTFQAGANPPPVEAIFDCPHGGNPCVDANANALQLSITNGGSAGLTVRVTAIEVPPGPAPTNYPPDGLCELGHNVSNDFDCRFVTFFGDGTDPSLNTIVPLCWPYANGNCVHYEVDNGTTGGEPEASAYTGPVNWQITWNNDTFTPPGPYWTGSTPQLYDDPDGLPTGTPGAIGTTCGTAMTDNLTGDPEGYSCQFEFNITTFFNPTQPVDSGIGGSTKAFNDVVVAFPPTVAGSGTVVQGPQTNVAPASISANCLAGCTTSGDPTISFTPGTPATVQLTSPSFPPSTLSASSTTLSTLKNLGLTLNALTGILSGTPSGTSSSTVSFTATNSIGSTTVMFTLNVGSILTATNISISAPPITYPAAGVVQVTVSASSGTPTGNVTLSVDNGSALSAPLNASGVATFTINGLSATTHSLSASYATQGTFAASGPTLGSLVVSPASTGISISAPPVTYPAAGVVKVTVTSAGGTPTGSVSLTVNNGTPMSGTLSGGVATFTISGLSASTYSLSASYAAQGNFAASGTATGSLVVSPAATSISLSAPTVTYPAAGVVKVTVTSAGGTPTGSVSLTVNNDTPMSGTLSGGVATFTLASPSPGTYNLSAKYAAQGNFAASGPVTGTLTVNSAGSTLKILPSSLNFGTVYINTTTLQSTTLTNTGTTMITFTNFAVQSISGDDSTGFLGVELCPKTLNAGKSCVIIMSFTADSKVTPVVHAANLVITDNGSGSPQTIPMTATVINPQASLSASSLSFGNQKTGTTSTAKTITVTNTGTTTLAFSSLSISGNFAIASSGTTCKSTTSLAPTTGKCTINVTFAPTTKGSKTGTLKITDNAKNSPQSISLSGTGG
jgi:YVTN family beta-propeller protein